MANNRIYYAVMRAGIAPINSNTYDIIRGLQSLGITTNFNLEQVFEIGQLAIYENIEGIPDLDISTEKVLDGYPPVYLLATASKEDGSAMDGTTLAKRAQGKCRMALQIYDETNDYAQGSAITELHMSGVYVSSVSYSVTVDGNASESCSLVGNNKVWVVGGDTGNFTGYDLTAASWNDDTPWSTGDSSPKAISGSGGVNRREDILFGSGAGVSLIPINIPGIKHGGTFGSSISGLNILSGGKYGAHIQSWNVSADLGREELYELGQRGTYYRYVSFPVEITNEISVISGSGDLVSATEKGIYDSGLGSCGNRYNLVDQTIKLAMCEGLVIDCGHKNKLSSVSVTGGDTGGGNVEITYTYTNFNDFDVKHANDTVAALRP